MSKLTSANASVTLGDLLLVLFIALKLTHVITWSWLWVLSPIWIGLAIAFIVLVIGLIMAGLAGLSK